MNFQLVQSYLSQASMVVHSATRWGHRYCHARTYEDGRLSRNLTRQGPARRRAVREYRMCRVINTATVDLLQTDLARQKNRAAESNSRAGSVQPVPSCSKCPASSWWSHHITSSSTSQYRDAVVDTLVRPVDPTSSPIGAFSKQCTSGIRERSGCGARSGVRGVLDWQRAVSQPRSNRWLSGRADRRTKALMTVMGSTTGR